ncbi:MAG: HD domain-containing phosphohydrolase [Thermodesulfovibrionales bacterium]
MENTRILIVDDEERILDSFSMLLEGQGYYVRTAPRFDAAVKLASEEKFDIAFVDQFLGHARGLDLIQRLADIDPGLYSVIITANGSTDLAVESLKKGASDFIIKPFSLADLLRSIDYINKKRELDLQKKELLSMLTLEVNRKTEELKKVYFSVLASLAQAIEKKDMGTYGHCRRVSYCSGLIAATLDLQENEREELKAAAMLHDIGKIGISDFVLGKKGPLNEEEKNIIMNHPAKGVEILKPIQHFEFILPIILHHHENYDGSGYPSGLSRENIPLFARIISVADTYDAILSVRPYRSAAGHDEAIAELLRCAGKQFDPRLVDALVEADKRYSQLFCPSLIVSSMHQPALYPEGL